VEECEINNVSTSLIIDHFEKNYTLSGFLFSSPNYLVEIYAKRICCVKKKKKTI
jgi:hypothetical protein